MGHPAQRGGAATGRGARNLRTAAARIGYQAMML
jgi:hypothetical protein